MKQNQNLEWAHFHNFIAKVSHSFKAFSHLFILLCSSIPSFELLRVMTTVILF